MNVCLIQIKYGSFKFRIQLQNNFYLKTSFTNDGVLFFFFFFGCAHGVQKFLGQGSNLCLSSDPSYSSEQHQTLTHSATRGLLESYLNGERFQPKTQFNWIPSCKITFGKETSPQKRVMDGHMGKQAVWVPPLKALPTLVDGQFNVGKRCWCLRKTSLRFYFL